MGGAGPRLAPGRPRPSLPAGPAPREPLPPGRPRPLSLVPPLIPGPAPPAGEAGSAQPPSRQPAELIWRALLSAPSPGEVLTPRRVS